jgi:hypothetical protein
MVLANDDEEDEEDLQPLSRRSRQPPGKILGQSTSGSKRGGDEENVPAAPAPKRRRSTAGRRVARRVAVIPSDSEETLSERGVLTDTPAADTEEEMGDGAIADEAPIMDDPVPPTSKEPVPEPSKNVAPGGERTTSPVAAITTEAKAESGVLGKTQGSSKKFKKRSVVVKKITR